MALHKSEIGFTTSVYNDTTLKMHGEVSEDYYSGKMRGYSVADSMESVRRNLRR